MSLSLSLANTIGAMFIMIGVGFILIKKNVCTMKESRLLSQLVLYVGTPCAIINSFQIELTDSTLKGFLFAIVAAIVIHIVFIIFTTILGKVFKFNAIERMSMMYPNCGNLIIPLVTIVLGAEMVLYNSGYMIIQTILLWTHCKFVISEEKEFDIKKIILNINILAILLGSILFIFQIKLPTLVYTATSMMSGLLAPLSMFVVGMLLAETDLVEAFKSVRVYLVCFFRLIVMPIMILLIIKLTGVAFLVENGRSILMISMLAASAPSASTVAQFAQLYYNNEFEAAQINGMSVLLCIITMPLINMLYSMMMGM